ncbi:MAG TPA: FAD:protein FMN transferase [Myxococcales bacterium]|jgi:thiamine biosynthesis lipoprotein|nr:FAD:protein FMN transferase [Myxococcales bacterium]
MTERLLRRARPALGTLVELGARVPAAEEAFAAFAKAWGALDSVERALSAFDPRSDISRFNSAGQGASISIGFETLFVLREALELFRQSEGLFDITQGTGPADWSIGDDARLHKHSAPVRIDLGGIGKGHAVDRAFETLHAALNGAPCWVNAGGDLRVAGLDLPVHLRDEDGGGARPWMMLSDGALATSWFGPGARSRLTGISQARHVSVAAPRCLHSDALTKVVAIYGRIDAPILTRHGATAWLHG